MAVPIPDAAGHQCDLLVHGFTFLRLYVRGRLKPQG
jgi:hypothetical protein